MATIVDTLFGVSPERLQQQRAAAADAQALAFARLSPIEKASFGIQRGAYDLAGALGGALGGQDPELQRYTLRQQIAGQIDYNDDASMQQGIIALRDANDPAGAMQLQQILLSQQAKRAGISKDEAAAKASLATASRERGPTGDVAKAIRVGEITRTLQIPEISELERIGLEAELSVLSPTKAKEPTTDAITNAAAFAASKGPIGTPEYTAAFQSKHAELTSKALNIKTVGVAKGTDKPVYFDENTNEQFTVGTGLDSKPVRQPYVGGVDRTTAKTTVDARDKRDENIFAAIDVKRLKDFTDASAAARKLKGDSQTIARLLKGAGGGQFIKLTTEIQRNLGFETDRVTANDLVTALATRGAVGIRAEGSGSTSDLEFNSYLQAFPSLANSEAGRELMSKYAAAFSTRSAKLADKVRELILARKFSEQAINEYDDSLGPVLDDEFYNFSPGRRPNVPVYTPPAARTPPAVPAAPAAPAAAPARSVNDLLNQYLPPRN